MPTVSIPLTQGKFALIDACDAERVLAYRWHASRRRHGWYARSYIGGGRVLYLHRLILDAPPDVKVDHWDGDGLNNRRANLRRATSQQNQQNAQMRVRTHSGFKGVCFHAFSGLWRSEIRNGQQRIYLGYFRTAEQAAHAYDDKAREIFGQFACVNLPRPGETPARETKAAINE